MYGTESRRGSGRQGQGLGWLPTRLPVLRHDRCIDAPPNVEFRRKAHKVRGSSGDQLIEDPVRHGFMERALVSIRPNVVFQRLQFDTQPIGDVFEMKGGEIRLACFRTQAGELGESHANGEIASGLRIPECFQNGTG